MNRPLGLSLLVVLAGAVVFYWPRAAPDIPDSGKPDDIIPEYRARLYAEQDEAYRERYALTDALMDISNGTPKILVSGFPLVYESEWRTIVKERFGVETEYVSGCESSAVLANYVVAYNAQIERFISTEFGPNALDESYEDAKRLHDAQKPKEG